MKRRRKVSHISNTVKEIFENIEQQSTSGKTGQDIVAVWSKAAGEAASAHSQPTALQNKTLVINVDSSAWIYQLRLKERDLLKKINTLLEKEAVQKIRFRAGQVNNEEKD